MAGWRVGPEVKAEVFPRSEYRDHTKPGDYTQSVIIAQEKLAARPLARRTRLSEPRLALQRHATSKKETGRNSSRSTASGSGAKPSQVLPRSRRSRWARGTSCWRERRGRSCTRRCFRQWLPTWTSATPGGTSPRSSSLSTNQVGTSPCPRTPWTARAKFTSFAYSPPGDGT